MPRRIIVTTFSNVLDTVSGFSAGVIWPNCPLSSLAI